MGREDTRASTNAFTRQQLLSNSVAPRRGVRTLPSHTQQVLVVATLALFFPAMAIAEDAKGPPRCPERGWVPGLGTACLRSDGLFDLFGPDGEPLGTTHGPDPAFSPASGPSSPASSLPPRTPFCVSATAGTYYAQVIYARAFDDTDRYATAAPMIRNLVGGANAYVTGASALNGADIRVACTSGEVTVANAVLSTPKLAASFTTIVSNLQGQGWTNPKVKHWVFYDDTVGCVGCAGVGHIQNDDRAIVNNLNNGNAGPMFAVTFGYEDVRVMLHELSHTLGAVQNTSPHNTGGFHCTDGQDTMCYNDNGPRGDQYTTSACPLAEVYDCNRDDYFNTAPPAGSYLATHWNLGSSIHRYYVFTRPRMVEVTCGPRVEVDVNVTCSFRANDDSAGLYYTVDWGDGTTTRLPSTGTVAPGVTQTATHAWSTEGVKVVGAVATDDAVPALTSNPRSTIQKVGDVIPPTVEILDPINNHVYQGCTKQGVNGSAITGPIFYKRGCARANVTDEDTGVASVKFYFANALVGTLTSAPYQVEFPITTTQFAAQVRVVALDNAGNSGLDIQSVTLAVRE